MTLLLYAFRGSRRLQSLLYYREILDMTEACEDIERIEDHSSEFWRTESVRQHLSCLQNLACDDSGKIKDEAVDAVGFFYWSSTNPPLCESLGEQASETIGLIRAFVSESPGFEECILGYAPEDNPDKCTAT